jgi:O-antigen ligase
MIMPRKFAQIFALIFIFTIPWENAFAFGSLGSISRIIGLATAGLWVISVLFQNRLRAFNYFHIVVFSFLLYNIASIFWTADIEFTYERAKTYLQMAIQIWMLWDLLTTEKLHRAALLAFLLGAYLTVANTIGNFLSGQLISQWEYGRYSGGGQNAVELGLILSLCFPIAWHLAITEKANRFGNLIKIICFSFIPTAFFALILTASRTALLTIIPGLVYILWSFRRFKPIYRVIGLIIFILAVLIGQSMIPQATLERLGTIGYQLASGDLGGRVELWKQSLEIFTEHPLLGIGSGSLAAPDQLGAFTHNTFLSILTELGILGFLLFLGVITSAVYQIIKQPRPSMVLWLIVLLTWIIGVQSLTWEYTKPTWFFLSMIAVSAGVIDRRSSSIDDISSTQLSLHNRGISRTRSPFKPPYPEKHISGSMRT